MKRMIIGCIAAIGLVLGGAVATNAGELNGNGDPVPGGVNGASLCSFSGRDLPDDVENNPDPKDNDDAITNGHVQNYGMFVRAGMKDAIAMSAPGILCRGNLEFPAE